MDIQGLNYNTEREPLLMHEYGREVQQMVDKAIALPTRQERQSAALAIISTMKSITDGTGQKESDRMQTLWNHLALLSDGKLDIDYPVDITNATDKDFKPQPVRCTTGKTFPRHYGYALSQLFDKLKTMQPGTERDALVRLTANQMKRSLLVYGPGNGDNERVASDLARFTDGIIQLDLGTFRFDNISISSPRSQQQTKKRKRKK